MDGSENDVLVIGSGVAGLTSAISLAEADLRVAIRTAAPPEATTSAVAGAVRGPVNVRPAGRVREWARIGLETLRSLESDPLAGIRSRSGRELSRVPEDPPEWADLLDDLRLCSADDLPPGFVSGWRYTAPVVSMPVYMAYLQARFERAGGTIGVNPVTSLAEVTDGSAGAAPVVVNCPGAAARGLVPDPDVTAIRGQIVVIANPGIEEFYIDHSPDPPDVIYLFPQRTPPCSAAPSPRANGTPRRGPRWRCVSCGTAPPSIPGCSAPTCSRTGSGSGRPGPRSGWRPSRWTAAACCGTTTATAGAASPCPGAARGRSPTR